MAKMDTQHQRDDLDKLRGKFKDLYIKRAPALKNYEALTNNAIHSLLGESLPAMQNLYAQAKGIGDASGRFLQSAEGYDTPERRAEERSRAMSDVETAGETARQGALARLESYGIDPSQTRGAALDQNLRVQGALDAVKAGRDAELGVEARGRGYVGEALDKADQSARTATGMAGTASSIGNAATGTAANVADMWARIYGTPADNLNDQRGLIGDTIKAKATETQLKIAGKGGSGTAAGIGSLVGMGAGAFLGSYGGPAGTMMGAQLGSQLGGAAGGAVGGGGAGGSATGMNFSGLPTSWGDSEPAAAGGGGSVPMPGSYNSATGMYGRA